MGETSFRTLEIPRSGSKAKDGEKERKRLNDGNNNGQATHGARKPPGPIKTSLSEKGHNLILKTLDFNFKTYNYTQKLIIILKTHTYTQKHLLEFTLVCF